MIVGWTPDYAAARGHMDALIDPLETRRVLTFALEVASRQSRGRSTWFSKPSRRYASDTTTARCEHYHRVGLRNGFPASKTGQ